MPKYDYECTEHGRFEAQNRIAERAEAPCPRCQASSPQVFSPEAGMMTFIPTGFHDGLPSREQVASNG